MSQLTIVANIIAKQGKAEILKTELMKLIATTRAEEGCINYDLHQDNENPNHFLLYENWQSRALWRAHMEAEHISAYSRATKDCVEQFTLNEMTVIG